MAVPLLLMGVGTALQIGSQWSANMAAGEAAFRNAKWYEEQAQFAADSMFRQMRITEAQYARAYGSQSSAYAKGGVDVGSGSALGVLSGTLANSISELAAVKKKGELDIKLARSRGMLEQEEGKRLTSPITNLMQAGGTFLTNYASTQGFGQGFPTWMAPSGSPPKFYGTGSYYMYGSNAAPTYSPSYLGANTRFGG